MTKNSNIEWTDHTFNPWRGCTKISDGCKNCYAETMSKRNPSVLGVWGPHGTRIVASEAMWREPLKWNKEAYDDDVRDRVFCASLADIFEGIETMPAGVYSEIRNARARLFRLIEATPHLDWLLLTKRPENIVPQVREVYDECLDGIGKWLPDNVWLGTSVEDQKTADERIPHLLACPAKVRFLSMEPLLGPVDLVTDEFFDWACGECGSFNVDTEVCTPDGVGTYECLDCGYVGQGEDADSKSKIHWVIVGGESGPGARACNVDWIRSIIGQCRAASVSVFVKQLGAKPVITDEKPFHGEFPIGTRFRGADVLLRDSKGGDMSEWPVDVRVRDLPEVTK